MCSRSVRQLRHGRIFLEVLPKEDKQIRGLVMGRRNRALEFEPELPRDAGYLLVRLLETEANLHEELTLRKKRLLEYEWREGHEHILQRSFTWLQSQSAVPGVTNVSVLGACRLLCDLKQVMAPTDVERIFHRVNTSGTDMLSYTEWENFLCWKEANEYLSDLYVKYYTTCCPGCGAMCQREGGACNNITCSVCRTTFRCDTRAENDCGILEVPMYGSSSGEENERAPRPQSRGGRPPSSPRMVRNYVARINMFMY